MFHTQSDALPSLQILGAAGPKARLFATTQANIERDDDLPGDLVLDREYVFEVTVIAFGPQVMACGGVDQLESEGGLVASLDRAC